MKRVRIRINVGKVGLIIRNGNYNRVVQAGVYWLLPWEEVREYDMAKPFIAPFDLNILLADEKLAQMLIVVEVKDNEIALQYENDNFKGVLTAGRYAFWNGLVKYKFVKADLSKIDITEDIRMNILVKPEVLSYVRAYTVESYEKGLLMIDGKLSKVLGTGVYFFWKNPIAVAVLKADMRQLQLEISGQEMLTKDKAALRVNFYTQYRITDIEKALLGSKDYEKQLYILMQLALREFIGMLSLDELLEKKEAIGDYVMSALKERAEALGVEIRNTGIRDIILPGEMKDIMNQVLIAQKKAQANIITRREETASTRSLLNTAKLMEENEMLFKLKEMEYVEKIAEKINSISLSGGSQLVDQLRDIFSPGKGE